MDCGWTDRRVACWTGGEGWRLRHPRRPLGWLGLWAFGNLARRRHDRLHRCGICWRGDFGRDHPLTEKSLIVEISTVRSGPGSMSSIKRDVKKKALPRPEAEKI